MKSECHFGSVEFILLEKIVKLLEVVLLKFVKKLFGEIRSTFWLWFESRESRSSARVPRDRPVLEKAVVALLVSLLR